MTCIADIRNPLKTCPHCEELAADTIRKLIGQADIDRDSLRAEGFYSQEQKDIVEEMDRKFLSLGE